MRGAGILPEWLKRAFEGTELHLPMCIQTPLKELKVNREPVSASLGQFFQKSRKKTKKRNPRSPGIFNLLKKFLSTRRGGVQRGNKDMAMFQPEKKLFYVKPTSRWQGFTEGGRTPAGRTER